MQTVTIPQKLANRDDLVVISRREYEALKHFSEFRPTRAHKTALAKAERNLRRGKTLSYHDLIEKLGFAN